MLRVGTDKEGGGKSIGLPETETVEQKDEAAKEKPKPTEDLKDLVLEIINKVSGEKGALYRDIIAECENRSVDKIQLEETIQELLDEGQIYEPTIGIIKPI